MVLLYDNTCEILRKKCLQNCEIKKKHRKAKCVFSIKKCQFCIRFNIKIYSNRSFSIVIHLLNRMF